MEDKFEVYVCGPKTSDVKVFFRGMRVGMLQRFGLHLDCNEEFPVVTMDSLGLTLRDETPPKDCILKVEFGSKSSLALITVNGEVVCFVQQLDLSADVTFKNHKLKILAIESESSKPLNEVPSWVEVSFKSP
jgi:hypothetical protein